MSNDHSQQVDQDFISKLSSKKQHAVALAVLFILPLILYSAIFFGGKQFLGNDVLQWRAGSESVIEYVENNDGEHPNWASNMFSGMPSYVLHNPPSPYNIDSFFKWIGGNTHPLPFFWILLGGAYFFFVIQGVRPFSAALGSILIGFTTYLPIIIEAGHYSKFMAFSFIPWMFVGYYMVSRWDKKLLAFFVFALAMILELRANHPQVTYYFLYLLGIWWGYDTYQAYIKDNIRDWMQRTGIAFGAGLLAILCSIDIYWRMYEYAQYSIRGGSALDATQGSGLSLEYAFSWSQGVGELLTLIIPGLYGGASGEAYWGPKSFTSGPHYFGAIAFLLALIGLFKYRKKLKYMFFGVGSLTMLFSLGYHFPLLNEFMFNYVPYFNKFRTPEMWLIVTVFCFSVLAVYGVEALFDIAKSKKKSVNDLLLPLGIAIGLGAIFTLGSNALLSFEKEGEAQQYAQQLARHGDIYVNDAFGAAHRAHASTEGVAHHVKQAAMGLLMEREVDILTKVRDEPEQPLAVILGGAKVSDKIGVIENLSGKADQILIGGAMSYTFLKALGHSVGASRVEEDRLDRAESLYEQAEGKLMLPSDHVVAEELSAEATPQTVSGDIPEGQMGLDIGPDTIAAYGDALAEAKTIIWNGPMGVFEIDQFAEGTMAMAEALADATDAGAYTVVGGGDSVAALGKAGYTDRISHVSTGGGAMLQLLEGKDLPGLTALTDK